jgi:hypothetical protein
VVAQFRYLLLRGPATNRNGVGPCRRAMSWVGSAGPEIDRLRRGLPGTLVIAALLGGLEVSPGGPPDDGSPGFALSGSAEPEFLHGERGG